MDAMLKDHLEQFTREYPDLVRPQGQPTLLMGEFTDNRLSTPQAITTYWKQLFGADSDPPTRQLLGYTGASTQVMQALQAGDLNVQGHTAHLVGSPDPNGVRKAPELHIIGLAPDLCPTCDPPDTPSAECRIPHPDEVRDNEITRFIVLNHELAHVLHNRDGRRVEMEKQEEDLKRHGATPEEAKLLAAHPSENLAETFALLRTVQVYGEQGYQAARRYMDHRLKQVSEGHPGLVSYFPPESRFALLEWAREHVSDLQKSSLEDLYTLAKTRSEPLAPAEILDVYRRAGAAPSSLDVSSATKRLEERQHQPVSDPPYLSPYDERVVKAEGDEHSASRAFAALNPYRPPALRNDRLSFGEWPQKPGGKAFQEMVNFGISKMPPDCQEEARNEGVRLQAADDDPTHKKRPQIGSSPSP